MRNCKLAFAAGALALGTTIVLAAAPRAPAPPARQVRLAEARIFFEYNSSANDLGVHVSLDGEDWTELEIENPDAQVIFQVMGKGPYAELGMTELFFEGAEPSLDEFPLEDLLDLFPEGPYEFSGLTVDGAEIEGTGTLSHAIPDGPQVSAQLGENNFLRISWTAVTRPPPGFPSKPIHIVGYQILVDPFEVILPGSARSVTVPPEFVASLGRGEHLFEVLAIDRNGNQTITEGSFVK